MCDGVSFLKETKTAASVRNSDIFYCGGPVSAPSLSTSPPPSSITQNPSLPFPPRPCILSSVRQALWLKKNEPELFARAHYVCEYQVTSEYAFAYFSIFQCLVSPVHSLSRFPPLSIWFKIRQFDNQTSPPLVCWSAPLPPATPPFAMWKTLVAVVQRCCHVARCCSRSVSLESASHQRPACR